MWILLTHTRRFLLDDITEMFPFSVLVIVIAFIKDDPIELRMQQKTADRLCYKKFRNLTPYVYL